jgi:hypothetical protein
MQTNTDTCLWVSCATFTFHFNLVFLARVLVGKTTGGSPTTRVCPPGFDTTGGGNVFVTYHDAQAYGEYLITFI